MTDHIARSNVANTENSSEHTTGAPPALATKVSDIPNESQIYAVAIKHLRQFWDGGDRTITSDLFQPDFIDWTALPGQANNLESFVGLADSVRAAFPDHHHELHQLVVADGWVTQHWTFHGTHTGEFAGIPPTNRKVAFRGTDFIGFRDGKLSEIYHVEDMVSFYRQVGFFPLASN